MIKDFEKWEFEIQQERTFLTKITQEQLQQGVVTTTFLTKIDEIKDKHGVIWSKNEKGEYRPKPLDLGILIDQEEDQGIFNDPLEEEGMFEFLSLHKRMYYQDDYKRVNGVHLNSILDHHESIEEFFEQENLIYQPVYLYSHSGDTISSGPFSNNWDSGKLGYLYTNWKDAKKNFQNEEVTKEEIIEDMKKFINSSWKQYIEGDFYYFNINDNNGSEFAKDENSTGFTYEGAKEEAEKAKQRILEKYNEIYKEYLNEETTKSLIKYREKVLKRNKGEE